MMPTATLVVHSHSCVGALGYYNPGFIQRVDIVLQTKISRYTMGQHAMIRVPGGEFEGLRPTVTNMIMITKGPPHYNNTPCGIPNILDKLLFQLKQNDTISSSNYLLNGESEVITGN